MTNLHVDLKPHLTKYLLYAFGQNAYPIIMSRHQNDISRFLYAMVDTYPCRVVRSSKGVELILKRDQNLFLDNATISLRKQNELAFVDYVRSKFNIEVERMLHQSRLMGLPMFRAIEMVMEEMNIQDSEYSFDAFKKMEYRKRQKIRKSILYVVKKKFSLISPEKRTKQ